MPTKVLLVDDHPVFRKGLRLLLEGEADLQVVGEACNGQAALKAVQELTPDLVVMDITMPDLNGIEATRRIISASPTTKVVALSIHSGKRFVEDMLQAGAAGYILKESAPEELVHGIRAVLRGDVFLSAAVTGIVVAQYVDVLSRAHASQENAELTLRERDVLRLTVEGSSASQVSSTLQISVQTVESTRQQLMSKFAVRNLADLTELARRMGLLESADQQHAAAGSTPSAVKGTKLHRPAITPDIVQRPHLLKRLEEGRRRPLTLISAGAGYGKSILASQWLEACTGPHAWISLDEDDNDVHSFLNCVLAAIQKTFPMMGQETHNLLSAPIQPPLSVLSRHLLNDLDELDESFIVVLDDYHHIRNPAVHDVLAELLRHPLPALHLVVLTRRDPPLPLSTLRAKGQMTEIAVEQLRFTAAETATFLHQILEQPVDQTVAATLEERTEGWITGLRLAALSLQDHHDLERIVSGLQGGFHRITEYLIAETLSQQPAVIAEFLTATSILDRFCAPLCDSLCGAENEIDHAKDRLSGQTFINRLMTTNLFVIALDEQHHWFRYHHLFQQLLQGQLKQRCNAEKIAALHLRASAWFADGGMVDEALQHALAADDGAGAARIVERHSPAALDSERWYDLARWLARLPDDIKQHHPELLLDQAWILYQQFRIGEISPILERIEALDQGASTEPALLGKVSFLSGYLSFLQGETERSLELFNRALQLLPEDPNSWIRSDAEMLLCLALYVSGERDTALRTISEKIRDQNLCAGMLWSRLVFGLAAIHLMSADLVQACRAARQLGEGAQRTGASFVEAWSTYLQGNCTFHSLDLDSARSHFLQMMKRLYILDTRAAVDGLAGLAVTCQLLGQPDQADETVKRALEFARSTHDPANSEIILSARARIDLLRNDLDAAERWQQSYDHQPDVPPAMFFLQNPWLTQCRVLVALGTDTSLPPAIEKLECLYQATAALHYTGQMVEIGALQALAYHRQGQLQKATALLEQVLILAKPGGWIRPFVELGPPMTDLLKRLIKQKVEVGFIEKILAASQEVEQRMAKHAEDQPSVSAASSRPHALFEPLTNREEEILGFLAQRLSDKEIAGQLFISPTTVKSHLKHIYEKLHVGNRRQAVSKAVKLGLLAGG